LYPEAAGTAGGTGVQKLTATPSVPAAIETGDQLQSVQTYSNHRDVIEVEECARRLHPA